MNYKPPRGNCVIIFIRELGTTKTSRLFIFFFIVFRYPLFVFHIVQCELDKNVKKLGSRAISIQQHIQLMPFCHG